MNHAEIIASGSQSFARAARLFPSALRRDALRLYAWCRHCDDMIDGQVLGHERQLPEAAVRQARLADLKQKTQAVMNGAPVEDPHFQALGDLMRQHRFPPQQPLALIEGFAFDVEGAAYPALNDTLRYCYHVAGVVGLMMARIMGTTDADTLNRACDLGLAFQLTNIARDLHEDARHGHLYAPLDWVAAHGLTLDALADDSRPQTSLALGQQLIRAAEPYYRSAYYGAMRLPFRAAWAIQAARLIYRDIGQVILKAETCLPPRATTSARRKQWRVIQAGFIAGYGWLLGRHLPAPPRVSGGLALWQRPV